MSLKGGQDKDELAELLDDYVEEFEITASQPMKIVRLCRLRLSCLTTYMGLCGIQMMMTMHSVLALFGWHQVLMAMMVSS